MNTHARSTATLLTVLSTMLALACDAERDPVEELRVDDDLVDDDASEPSAQGLGGPAELTAADDDPSLESRQCGMSSSMTWECLFQPYWDAGCNGCLVEWCLSYSIANDTWFACYEWCQTFYDTGSANYNQCMDGCATEWDSYMCYADEAYDNCTEWLCEDDFP